MTGHPLWRRGLAEFVGTGLLVTVIVGSGIAAERLSTDAGLRLLENSIATALGLAVLVLLFAAVSGAHFNPVVSLADVVLARGRPSALTAREAGVYLPAQLAGAVGGAVLANAMFSVSTTISATPRAAPGTLLAEVVATTGLVLLIVGLSRSRYSAPVIAPAVGAYIGAAYWFTSSTSFANPAVTLGRVFTDTFTGISPLSALLFAGAQMLGAGVAVALSAVLFPPPAPSAAHD